MPASPADQTIAARTRRDYPEWKAPVEDGQTLIWPAPRELLADTIANRKLLDRADQARIQNVPLPELRRLHRAWLGTHADAAKHLAYAQDMARYFEARG